MKTIIKRNEKTGEDIFTISTSYVPMNYDEEGLMFVSFHTNRSVSILLNENELEKLIEKLIESKNFLKEKK